MQTNPSLDELLAALSLSWGEDTAYGSRWSEDCPALNQCTVTAMVVQDFYGGELLRCPMEGRGWHYWNRLADGRELDFTEAQFAFIGRQPLREQAVVRPRSSLMKNAGVRDRYERLRERVDIQLRERASDPA